MVKDLNAPENAPDMNRYYYPPGTTEPQLRPEFANEVEQTPKAEEKAEPKKPAAKKATSKVAKKK